MRLPHCHCCRQQALQRFVIGVIMVADDTSDASDPDYLVQYRSVSRHARRHDRQDSSVCTEMSESHHGVSASFAPSGFDRHGGITIDPFRARTRNVQEDLVR